MSDHSKELNCWKALAQDPAWDDFVAPCSCYEDALREGLRNPSADDIPEKEVRPKLLFTTPGEYPILVCEYCGHDVIGETIEQCIAKHNAAMHEYDLVASGSIWEGKPAWYPLTEQMVLFGFKMATRGEKLEEVSDDTAKPETLSVAERVEKAHNDPISVYMRGKLKAKAQTVSQHSSCLDTVKNTLKILNLAVADSGALRNKPDGEAGPIRAPEQEKTADAGAEVGQEQKNLIDNVNKSIDEANRQEQESVDEIVDKIEAVMDEIIHTEPSNTTFDEVVAKTAERLGKTVEELHEAVQSKTNPSDLADEELKPEKEAVDTWREPTEKEVLFFGTAAAGRETKQDIATEKQTALKLGRIVGACMTANKLTIAPAKQDVVVLYGEGTKVYKISNKPEYNEIKILDLTNKGYKGASLVQQATSRKPQFTVKRVDRVYDTLPDGYTKEDVESGNLDHFASICVVNKQLRGDDVLVWHVPVDLKPAMAKGFIPSWPSLAEIVSQTTAEPPQEEKSDA